MDLKQISEMLIFTGGNMQVVLAGTQRVQSSSLVLGDHFWREILTFYPGIAAVISEKNTPYVNLWNTVESFLPLTPLSPLTKEPGPFKVPVKL